MLGHLPVDVTSSKEKRNMGLLSILWTIAVILIVLWVLGLVLHIAGGLIHILLIIAAIIIIYNIITHLARRRSTV
jgi:4-hydroxybenzoate polyprenyltransferase